MFKKELSDLRKKKKRYKTNEEEAKKKERGWEIRIRIMKEKGDKIAKEMKVVGIYGK